MHVGTAPPTLTHVSPSFIVGRDGSSVDMRCDATGVPPPSVTWLKDSRQLDVSTDSPRVSSALDGRRLVISHLVHADAGVYRCQFKNSVSQTSHDIRLVVEGPSTEPITQAVFSATVSCKSKARNYTLDLAHHRAEYTYIKFHKHFRYIKLQCYVLCLLYVYSP